MNLRPLETFQAVMVSGSATAAAERMGISQSAVSRILAKLEEELGLRLFLRQKGRLVPTGEAGALLNDVQRLVESAQGFRRRSEQLRRGGIRSKLLRVAAPEAVALNVLPALAARFMQDHPDVVLEILSTTYFEGERVLHAREVDLALLQLPVNVTGVELLSRFETEMVCVLPHGHAWAHEPQLTPEMLEEHPLVLLGRRGRNRQDLDAAFRRARVQMRVAVEATSSAVACAFVAAGMGIGLLNSLLASCCRDLPLHFVPFAPRVTFEHVIALLPDAPVAARTREFCAVLGAALARTMDSGERKKA